MNVCISLNNFVFKIKIEKQAQYCDYDKMNVYLNGTKLNNNKIKYSECQNVNEVIIKFN